MISLIGEEAVARAIERSCWDFEAEFEECWPTPEYELVRHNRMIEARAAISAHLAALTEAGLLQEWQPIETCPEREAHVFVYCPHAGRFKIQGWLCGPGADPKVCGATHWMPCPAPPTQNGDEATS